MEDLHRIVKKSFATVILIAFIVIIVLVWMFIMKRITNKDYYGAGNFGIKTVYSSVDYNNNGIDDYSDFVLGARNDPENALVSAFKNAGYDLEKVNGNLLNFFLKYAAMETLDSKDISKWQPGDIVYFDNEVGIVSDKRNKKGITFVIYKYGEKDILESVDIKFHFRFDASQVKLNIID